MAFLKGTEIKIGPESERSHYTCLFSVQRGNRRIGEEHQIIDAQLCAPTNSIPMDLIQFFFFLLLVIVFFELNKFNEIS